MRILVVILLSVFTLGSIYSCRPSYMKCPKNRRCVDLNKVQKQDLLIVSNSNAKMESVSP